MSAEVAKTRLESAGIEPAIADANFYTLGYGAVMDGVRLQVPAADAERARAILLAGQCMPLPDDEQPVAEAPEANALNREPAEAPPGNAPGRLAGRSGLFLFLFGLFCLVLGRPGAEGRAAHALSGQLILAGAISIMAGLWIAYGRLNIEKERE